MAEQIRSLDSLVEYDHAEDVVVNDRDGIIRFEIATDSYTLPDAVWNIIDRFDANITYFQVHPNTDESGRSFSVQTQVE